jgi:DNA-binding transcriptional LysR family regulator
VQVSGPVSTRDFNTVSTFVLHGHGIGLAPSFHCEEHIARGQLVRLLPKWTSPPIPVFAVYQSRKYLPLRLSVFLRALATWRSPLWIKDSM